MPCIYSITTFRSAPSKGRASSAESLAASSKDEYLGAADDEDAIIEKFLASLALATTVQESILPAGTLAQNVSLPTEVPSLKHRRSPPWGPTSKMGIQDHFSKHF